MVVTKAMAVATLVLLNDIVGFIFGPLGSKKIQEKIHLISSYFYISFLYDLNLLIQSTINLESTLYNLFVNHFFFESSHLWLLKKGA